LTTSDRTRIGGGYSVRVQTLERECLPQLLELVNVHLSAVVPGWALTEEFLSAHLQRDHTEPITEPWVVERTTLCAVEEERVLAAAHLSRYGDGKEVGEALRGTGEINWLLGVPRRPEAATAVLAAARERLSAWEVAREEVWGGGMFVPAFCGVPDAWPHVTAALEAAGYRPDPEHREALYGGELSGVPAPEDPVLCELRVLRLVGTFGTRFSAVLDGEELGHCECVPDLTRGGALPALNGWAELAELEVREGWRRRGIGEWLVGHAASWLRSARCDRVVLSVAAVDEAAGAGRFYRRFGWCTLAREIRSWKHQDSPCRLQESNA
jgi:GNAT superfamily N-acetyltransferase